MALISDQEWQIAEVADAGLLALTVALAVGVFAVCVAFWILSRRRPHRRSQIAQDGL